MIVPAALDPDHVAPAPDEVEVILTVARALLRRALSLNDTRGGERGARRLGADPEELARALAPLPAGALDEVILRDAEVAAAIGALDEHLATAEASRLRALALALGLAPLDVLVVVALVAPELDVAIARGYAAAWEDFTRKQPDVRFLAALLAGAERALDEQFRARLASTAPLRRQHVVVLGPGDDLTPHAARPVRLADRVVGFLRGADDLEESIAAHVHVVERPPALADLVMPATTIEAVRRALALTEAAAPARIVLLGQAGSGRGLLVEALAAEAGRGALRADLDALVADPTTLGERLAAVLQEAALRGACCILDHVPPAPDADARAITTAARDALAAARAPVVLIAEARERWVSAAIPRVVEISVPPPGFRERIELWRRAVPTALAADPADLELAATRYAFTGATIQHAAEEAAQAAWLRDPAAPRITLDDLSEAARHAFSTKLGELAQRIPPAFTWSDLVLPEDTTERLREIVRFARLRPFLLEQWGFGAKLPYGRGVSAILAGPPGTGKTMVAQLLARELGYELYRIDLSQVVNKYIGETEKNLGRIFTLAESSHAILFFDEADSLFAKRTEVKSSNDRYANLEVNYLLQRMETYDGVTLLATNLEQGIDPAFKRRVRFMVQFEMPDSEQREALWRSMFPAQVPIAPDLDWQRIADRFEMSGGYIKKAALRAAAAIAGSDRPLQTADLVEAALHEYREMGRITSG